MNKDGTCVGISDLENAIRAMRRAFIEGYPNPDPEEEAHINELADRFEGLTREYLSPIHDALFTTIISLKASTSSPNLAKSSATACASATASASPRPAAEKRNIGPRPSVSMIPPTSKQLHAHIVWQKARIHGLIPADSVYQVMCPNEASKKRFYNQYVLKIIAIDEGAAKAVLNSMKAQNIETQVEEQVGVRRVRSLNHMQLFRLDFCKTNPHPTVSQIREAWDKLTFNEQQAYKIRANTHTVQQV